MKRTNLKGAMLGVPLASLLALASATPAFAAVNIVAGGSTTTLGVDESTTLNFNGFTDAGVISGLTSSLTLTLLSQSAEQTVFGFLLSNTSTDPMTAARLSAFGFDVNPLITSASIANSIFDGVVYNANMPNGIGRIDVCFTAQNCPGAGGNGTLSGLQMGQTDDGQFTLNFAGGASDINLSNFAVRYQSMAGAGNITSATGIVTSVPEPATWALMLIGFGAVGFSMRRGRHAAPRLTAMA